MEFVGKVCPYCKSEITEEDDIVICSVCEMPHHKECWIENKGCTTFGCTGTIMGIDYNDELNSNQYSTESDNISYSEINANDDLYNIDDEINMLLGKNKYYYYEKFSSKVSWNWASAFFGGFWYAYRKMYVIQILYYVVALFCAFIPRMQLILFVASGILGNYLYKGEIEKRARIAKSLDINMKQDYISKKEGTNEAAIGIIIVIRIVLNVIMNS